MKISVETLGFHQQLDNPQELKKLEYTFQNHFHPRMGQLVAKLNRSGLPGLLDVKFHTEQNANAEAVNAEGLNEFEQRYGSIQPGDVDDYSLTQPGPMGIDTRAIGAYSIYNWELLFHLPLTVAVHLSKNQRFAEAQRWFHFIFDPTSTDEITENSNPSPKRFWKFLTFREKSDVQLIDDLMSVLAKPKQECSSAEMDLKDQIEHSISGWREKPFQPHVIARTRFVAYQMQVVMKYLDNLIAWGDSLFRQDTIETLNEATQIYILAANLLGPKPQEVPRRGATRPLTFHAIRHKLDDFSNALEEFEAEFPFNLTSPGMNRTDTNRANTLLGIGRSLYFCIPRNDKLLSYWDTVGDRLFKIRHCLNIEGMVRQLPLFEPPIDPGMLVKAAAAGIDLSSVVSGLNQPPAPVRAQIMIQKALEICAEVRSLGSNLLAAMEKKDGESLALLRQRQDMAVQDMVRDVRFLQWKDAQANTDALLQSRETVFQRYRHYQLLLGKQEGTFALIGQMQLQRKALLDGANAGEVAANYDQLYLEMIGEYAKAIELEPYPLKDNAGETNPSNQSGATGGGKLNLNKNEDKDINEHGPKSKDYKMWSSITSDIARGFKFIPKFMLDFHYWGIGGHSEVSGGDILSGAAKIASDALQIQAQIESDDGTSSSKTASYERRSEDWILQNNLAAKELVQIGRQIIASLIREQISKKEYDNQLRQIEFSQEIDTFLRDKFTSEQLYAWMQSELSKVYYECYKFAFDVAKQAERTMKHELMRPELDQRDFMKFNYWDAGRKGLLAGDTLYLDLKRLEMAYHEHNKREYELTKHISLQQLNPIALLQLKTAGFCEITLPEWLFDMDCPGHYMRRIKTVSVTIPCVAGPYLSINCTLSLQKSTIRKSSLGDSYARDTGNEDGRFLDYYGTIQSIVTSNAQNDSGLFETNLRDERYLPFEGAGAISTWRLEIPSDIQQFDYNTITDVILHLRYTAREGGQSLRDGAVANFKTLFGPPDASLELFRLFSLQHDYPNEWHRYSTGTDETMKIVLKKEQFPYFTNGRQIKVSKMELHSIQANDLTSSTLKRSEDELTQLSEEINTAPPNPSVVVISKTEVEKSSAAVFLLVKYYVS